ncbi:MAG: TraR/DksA family transcriptional regulator [Spirochaetaceae bacterium]|nr:TraR/DksA family transcriptional regulator [Spirochaetaceae bacterium]
MEKDFIQSMKEKMLEEKKDIINSLVANDDDSRKILSGSSARDSIDEASDAVDLNMLQYLGEKDMNRLNLINAALTRIELGKYGLCMKCGKQIPEARLEYIPYAVLCVDCKSADERRNR